MWDEARVLVKGKNVGSVQFIDDSIGKSLIRSDGKVTDRREFDDNQQFYFHEHRPTAKTDSEWDLKVELKREYLTSGQSIRDLHAQRLANRRHAA
jgi:hypothetical protein